MFRGEVDLDLDLDCMRLWYLILPHFLGKTFEDAALRKIRDETGSGAKAKALGIIDVWSVWDRWVDTSHRFRQLASV